MMPAGSKGVPTKHRQPAVKEYSICTDTANLYRTRAIPYQKVRGLDVSVETSRPYVAEVEFVFPTSLFANRLRSTSGCSFHPCIRPRNRPSAAPMSSSRKQRPQQGLRLIPHLPVCFEITFIRDHDLRIFPVGEPAPFIICKLLYCPRVWSGCSSPRIR